MIIIIKDALSVSGTRATVKLPVLVVVEEVMGDYSKGKSTVL